MSGGFQSPKGLARHLGWRLHDLESLAGSAARLYSPFDRRRVAGVGKWRHIDKPLPPLLEIQRRIHRLLLRDLSLPETIFGVRGRGVIDNAAVHVGKETVVCLDLYQCYPQISDRDVFRSWTDKLGFGHRTASLLTKLTTRRYRLPQGSPTSPMLAVVVLLDMYEEIQNLAAKLDVTVSFYADDITISGEGADRALGHVIEIIHAHGHRVSRSKIKVMRRNRDEQRVTGIVTGDELSVGGERLHSIRDEILGLSLEPNIIDTDLKRIQGRIEYVRSVNAREAEPLLRLSELHLPDVGAGGKRPRTDEVRRCARSRRCLARRAL